MLLAALALIGFTSVIVTSTDLKISSNYKGHMKAFYIAEAGIHDGIGRLINGTISDSGSETDTDWNKDSSYSSNNFSNSFTVKHHIVNGNVVTSGGLPLYKIICTGTSGTANKTLEVVIKLRYPSVFDKALHGCDGLAFDGNGTIESYSSSGSTTDGQYGDVGTSNPNADVTLNGDAVIKGNISAAGNLSLNGDVDVKKNALTNNGIRMVSSSRIRGNANTGSHIGMDGYATIEGNAI